MHRSLALTCLLSGLVVGTAQAGTPFFETPTSLPNACGADGCWTNYLRVTDLDGDGDLDIVSVNMQGLFNVGAGEPLAIYANDGAGIFTNTSAAAVGGHEGQHRQVAIGDIDGDGDVDMYAPHANGGVDTLFRGAGDGTFVAEVLDLGSSAGAARFGDLDDDGDLDLVLTDGYAANDSPTVPGGHIYLNDGRGGFTELEGAGLDSVPGNQPIDLDLLDVDGDFDLDIVIDAHQQGNGLFLNDGAAMFTDASDGLPPATGNHYNPAICDVDGDGDLDMWVDNSGPSYTEQLLINDGSGVFTDETEARVSGNTEGADDNGLICVDFDQDGDFDAIVVALFTPNRYLMNEGGEFTQVSGAIPGGSDSYLWADVGDLNGDAILDLVAGAGESASVDRVYLGSVAQATDTTPPALRAAEMISEVASDTAVVVHFALTDVAVTDEGPRLDRAFVHLSIDGRISDVDAAFMGGDLFRAELPGQPDGTTISYQLCGTDAAGNEGCGPGGMYQVGAGGGTSGGSEGGAASESGVDDTVGADTSASASGAGTNASATVSASASDDGGTGDSTGGPGQSGGGEGCSCRNTSAAPSWAGLIALALGRARRRRR